MDTSSSGPVRIARKSFLPKILWALLVYKVPVSTVEGLERKIRSHFRRWRTPRSLSSIMLHRLSNKLQIPLRFLEEEFKLRRSGGVAVKGTD